MGRRSRLALLVLPAIVAVLLGIPPAGFPGTAPDPVTAAPMHLEQQAITSALPLNAHAWNTTLRVPGPDASSTPTSALMATPPPILPPTVPVVLTFLTASRNTTLTQTYASPAGPWALILLNYTGTAVSGVYDSSYRAYVNQSMVLFGTTPEYGTWTVLQDLTEYSANFHGSFNLTFLLGAAVTSGYFLTSLSIAFYPVPAGASAPAEPTVIVPLWYRVTETTAAPTVYTDVNVPSNAVNATLELFTYGFGPDEFWYSSAPGYRYLAVGANGTEIARVLPFQYVNTGGIDLFTWRPITAAYTLNDRPYRLNVTAALGLLEGSVNLTAHLQGISASSDWITSGSLLLFTDPSASASSFDLSAYQFSAPPPVIASSSTYERETAGVSYRYASTVGLPSGPTVVNLWRNLSFTSDLEGGASWAGATWSNFTGDEVASETTRAGTDTSTRAMEFRFTMSIGSAFVETSSNNGSYPIYGNFTTLFNGVDQRWSEHDTDADPTTGLSVAHAISHEVVAPVNSYGGMEELTSPNAALLLSIDSVQSETSDLYVASQTGTAGLSSYAHLLVGAGYQPPGPYNAETVYQNVVSAPLLASLAVSQPATDVGVPVTFSVATAGGAGTATIGWYGLPTGCDGAAATSFACTPSVPGLFTVTALATDPQGTLAVSNAVLVQVDARPTVSAAVDRSVAPTGGTVNLSGTIEGGTGALMCAVTAPGLSTITGPCGPVAASFTIGSSTAGNLTLTLTVTDALGVTSAATPVTVSFVDAPTVSLLGPSGSVYVYTPVDLAPYVTGGAAPFVYSWILNGTPIDSAGGPTFEFVPLGAGNYTFAVTVSDGAGHTVASADVLVTAVPRPSNGSATPITAASSSGVDPIAYVLLGLVVGVAAGVGLMALLPARKRPAKRPGPRRSGAPPRAQP